MHSAVYRVRMPTPHAPCPWCPPTHGMDALLPPTPCKPVPMQAIPCATPTAQLDLLPVTEVLQQ
jgi:hypothetical protein